MDIPICLVIVLLLAVLGLYSWFLLRDDIEKSKENYYVSEQERWYALWPGISRLPEKYRKRITNAVLVAKCEAQIELEKEREERETDEQVPTL